MANDKSVRASLEDAFEAHDQDEKFERALGRLMIAWADVEYQLYRTLIAYSGVDEAAGRAIFSGLRAKTMTEFINNIAHNTGMAQERKTDLAYVFAQLGPINKMRDHLVHHTSSSYSFKNPRVRVVATKRSSRYGNNTGYEVSVETVDAMTWDLYGIANHLNMHHGHRSGPFFPWREDSDDGAPTPWTYKAPQPIESWEKSRSDSRGSPPPPPPSAE